MDREMGSSSPHNRTNVSTAERICRHRVRTDLVGGRVARKQRILRVADVRFVLRAEHRHKFCRSLYHRMIFQH